MTFRAHATRDRVCQTTSSISIAVWIPNGLWVKRDVTIVTVIGAAYKAGWGHTGRHDQRGIARAVPISIAVPEPRVGGILVRRPITVIIHVVTDLDLSRRHI